MCLRFDINMMNILKDPLTHFLLIGLALFLVFDWMNPDEANDPALVVVTQWDLDLLTAQSTKTWGRPPTREEKQLLLNAFTDEQMLYREAIALGLDQQDQIVRRRLAQKMEFLFSDLVPVPEPTEADLESYHRDNAQRFEVAPKISFQQIFLMAEDREAARQKSEVMAAELNSDASIDATTLGDRAWLPMTHRDATRTEVANSFGSDFAQQIFDIESHQWVGAIESALGLHVVLIESTRPAELPSLDTIRDRVTDEWRREKQRQLREAFMESLRQKYQVDVSGLSFDSS